MKVKFKGIRFVYYDLWMGIYWKWKAVKEIRIYICIIPMLPIMFDVKWRKDDN
jgi:hypothetical protein